MKLEQTGDGPDASGHPTESKVLDLTSFRRKKETVDELARGRQPLYASHLNPTTAGTRETPGTSKRQESQDFGDRLQRIRSSLEKINRLMSELKKMSAPTDETPARPR